MAAAACEKPQALLVEQRPLKKNQQVFCHVGTVHPRGSAAVRLCAARLSVLHGTNAGLRGTAPLKQISLICMLVTQKPAPLVRPRQTRVAARVLASGVTLLELMVVVAVVAVLLGIAVPSFVKMTQTNRVAGEINALSGDLQFARAEAIKEGLPVTICTSSNGSSCLGSSSWSTGWIVFSDANGTQTVDAGDVVLRKQIPWTNSDTFIADNSTVAVTYSRDGFATALPGTVTWKLHTQPLNAAASRCVAVNIAGRQQVQKTGSGSCT